MKKLLTIDDVMIAFVSALGCGTGETVPRLFGLPELLCVAAGMAAGAALEEIISRAVFSKAVQKKRKNRILAYAAILLVFLAAHTVSVRKAGVSLWDYLMEECLWVVGMPVLGFLGAMLLRWFRVRRIRSVYGDGSGGYVFDVDDEDVAEINRQNQPVSGDYDVECAVETGTGVYVGEKQGEGLRFLGIPYAKPPVGDLRWKAPEPIPASREVFEAKHFGASAVQPEQKGVILRHHRQSEDCLSLNIWGGRRNEKKKRPVLVLFHHGGFSYGGSADPLLYGDVFAEAHPDVVLVSFNYRLGIFGFIDFSEIPGGEAYPDAPDLGLLDQIAALRWIRDNIAAFGGDPARVTAAGFGAGATSVCLLAACGQAKGLFRNAFIFNGSLETVYDTPEGARALAAELLKETKTATMEELAGLDTEALRKAEQRLRIFACAPTCGGSLIPKDVYRAYEESAASGISFILGIPADERHVLRSFVGSANFREQVSAAVDELKSCADGPVGDAVRKQANARKDAPEAGAELVEQWISGSIYRSAELLKKGGSRVHLLYWKAEPLIGNLGSGTVDAAAAFLGNREALELYGSVLDPDVSGILQAMLSKFVRGEPLKLYHNEIKGVDALDWKAFPKALTVTDEIVCQ